MKSHVTMGFRSLLRKLPVHIQKQAVKSYEIWKFDTTYPSLHFKRLKIKTNTWSVRVGISYRALGIIREGVIVWFWIGSHAEYDYLIKKM